MNVASRAPQMKRDWLDWPFFGESHRTFPGALDRFVASGAIAAINHGDVDASCRKLAWALGEAGLLDAAVASPDGDASAIDSRSVCLARETLAYHDGLADFAFAMQIACACASDSMISSRPIAHSWLSIVLVMP